MKKYIHADYDEDLDNNGYEDEEYNERSDGDILYEAEMEDGFLEIEDQVAKELGLYFDFSTIRGDYGTMFIFSDPKQESNADMWLGDQDAELAALDYREFAYNVVNDILSQDKSKWKQLFTEYVRTLID